MADSIVVIQCAGRKQPNAGHLRNTDGRKVMFVAKPDEAPKDAPYAYAHPDAADASGESWRENCCSTTVTRQTTRWGYCRRGNSTRIQLTNCFTGNVGRATYTSFRRAGD